MVQGIVRRRLPYKSSDRTSSNYVTTYSSHPIDIPDELIQIIIDYTATSLLELYQLQQIDKHWRRICQDNKLWLTLNDAILLPPQYLFTLFHYNRSQGKLISSVDNENLETLELQTIINNSKKSFSWYTDYQTKLQINGLSLRTLVKLEYENSNSAELVKLSKNLTPLVISQEYGLKIEILYETYRWANNWGEILAKYYSFHRQYSDRITAGVMFSMAIIFFIIDGILIHSQYHQLSVGSYHTIFGLLECNSLMILLWSIDSYIGNTIYPVLISLSHSCLRFTMVCFFLGVLIFIIQMHVTLSRSSFTFPFEANVITQTVPSWICLIVGCVPQLFYSQRNFRASYGSILQAKTYLHSQPLYIVDFLIYVIILSPYLISATIALYHVQYSSSYNIMIAVYCQCIVIVLLICIAVAVFQEAYTNVLKGNKSIGILGMFLCSGVICVGLFSVAAMFISEYHMRLPVLAIALLGFTTAALGYSVQFDPNKV